MAFDFTVDMKVTENFEKAFVPEHAHGINGQAM